MWKRPARVNDGGSNEASPKETLNDVETTGVAEVTTRLVPTTIGPSPSVVGLVQRPEEAGVVSPVVGECKQLAQEKVATGARVVRAEQERSLVDWSQRIEMPWKAPEVRRSETRVGIWGFPLERHAGSSTR